MKINIKKLKFFIFGVFNIISVNIGLAQNTSLDTIKNKDSLQIYHDEYLKTPFGTFNLKNTTGNVFRISGDDLRVTAGDNLINALRGRVPGLRITRIDSNPAAGGYSYLLNGRTPTVLIDGQPRGLQVDLREVKEVIVFSDATFNSLLGNFGENGLIYVITQSGNNSNNVKPTINFNYQRGLSTVTRLPKRLTAAEYANVINRASNNDGFGDIYSAEAIQAYENETDPILFPNVDTQETYLNNSSPTNLMSLNVYGGNKELNYSGFIGYSDWKGLEKVGDQIDGRNITFRTKIEAKLNSIITANASIFGRFSKNKRPVIDDSTVFNWINNTPANAFPIQVGDTAYIVSNQFQTNLLSELEFGGTRTDYNSNMIYDLGLDFDLNEFVKGLSYSTYVMTRNNNAHSLVTNNRPATFTIETLQDINGVDSLSLKVFTTEFEDLQIGRNNATITRYFSYGGNFNYIKEANDGVLNLNLSHLLYYQPNRTSTQTDIRNLNFNLNATYVLHDKYTFFANANSISSSRFLDNNKSKIFPTLGVSWIASNEDYLKNNKVINYLKFRTSYGIVGTEYDNSSLLYLDTWAGGRGNNTTYLGTGNTAQDEFGYRLGATGNQEIDWVIYNQFNAGFDLSLLNKFNLSVNYFDIEIQNQITNASALFATALGNDVYLPQLNFTESRNVGFNANINYTDKVGGFKYYVNANLGTNKITGEKIAEVPFPDQYRLEQGQPQDLITGYISDGLFTAENIGSALPQFGDVQIGDIKYVDQNGDNIIDPRDQRAIGNTNPRFNYGINIGMEYEGFNLDVIGMGLAGYDVNLNSISYYQHSGLGTYFGSVNSDLPNGNANPRLSTITSVNNYRNSDYWLVDGSYFRIANVELGYTLKDALISKSPFSNVKLFFRGNNLAVFSKIKDLDPEDLSAGVSQYPIMRTFVLGASLNF
ncbi:SusC/RagA family TonB-linked outer membrane protein [uncultured Polaribacter sp.]|uniref:SusC/RagA family TonB-linked outer membrane protein n=1 Tax=uncultured Polaribacter sp. TaxID=174711 RepID=UPI00260D5702|nr:SusC/RagA family TonB-linked outer membrane protein [uncultured Polaribacter sp.]